MKRARIVGWLDGTLKVGAFDDVSNNGLQMDAAACGLGDDARVSTVAFAVDASVRAVEAAAMVGAQLLVVHHGISWGGGIRRVVGGVGRVVRAAFEREVSVYACHLPLDAHPTLGNNAQLAKLLALKKVKKAFSYHGNVIGLTGEGVSARVFESLKAMGLSPDSLAAQTLKSSNAQTLRVGVCSGGAGEFAEEAKRLGCDLYITGEASWGDVIAAENCGMKMLCLGHYATEVFGVRALAKAMRRSLKVKTVDLTDSLR